MVSGTKQVWTTKTGHVEERKNSSLLNKILWLIILIAICGMVFCSMYIKFLKNSSAIMASFIIVGCLVLLIVAKYTNQGSKGWKFLLDSRLEMRKVVWPTRKETINSTLIVLVIVIVASTVIYFVGLLFMYLIQTILS